jgi:hypothetical protein
MQKKIVIAMIVLASFVGVGFVAPFVFGGATSGVYCTMMACICDERVGEIECNSCGESTMLFQLGILNVQRDCGGREILQCGEGDEFGTSSRVQIDPDSCRNRVFIFSTPLDELFSSSDPNATTSSEENP